MWFRVFLWLYPSSVEAEVFQLVQAADASAALALVMQMCELTVADTAWVVPEDDMQDCYSASPVFGTTQPRGWASIVEETR